MKQLIKDIITGLDGESADIARVIMIANAVLLIPILFIGVVLYIYGYFVSKPFDMQSLFTAVLTYIGGVGTLLTSGAAAIYFKRTTEPDGSETTVESIRKEE